MPQYEIYEDRVIYTDSSGGAILEKDELWYPFRYFACGDIDILDEIGYFKPSKAYNRYKEIYT